MREYKKNTYVSDSNRLTEKAFKQSITISIIGILLCMAALCSVTWAWFSTEISSSSNDIKSAYCDVTVSVMNDDTKINPVEGKYVFAKDTSYKITIAANGNAETAYCILKISGAEYYTAQIPIGTAITFKAQFNNDETTEVEIIKCWGTSSVPVENRTFADGGLYLNCVPVAELPQVITETNSTTATTVPQSADIDSTIEEQTTLDVVTESEATNVETTTKIGIETSSSDTTE